MGEQSHPVSVLASGTECCVVMGQPILRSVHREVCRPCDRAPKWPIAGADAVKQAEGNIRVQNSIAPDPAGVREQGMRAMGSTRNLGDPAVSAVGRERFGKPRKKFPGPYRKASAPVWERRSGCRAVPEGEGNEAGGEGRQGVGAARSTEESGEPTQGTLRRKGVAR